MPTFRYRAIDASGKQTSGIIEGPDERFVIGRLTDMGHVPLAAKKVGEDGLNGVLSMPVSLGRKFSAKEVQLLTREVAVLLKAGVPLEEALRLVTDVTRNAYLQGVLEVVLTDLRDGAGLARSIGKHPDVFDNYYCSMVRAGEQSGQLEDVFSGLAQFLEQRLAIGESIKSALVYPMILAVLVVATLVLVVTVVLPEFKPIFDDLGADLPLATRIAVGIGTIFQDYWWLLMLAAAAFVMGVSAALRNPDARFKIDAGLLRSPLLGALIQKAETGRFSRALGALLRGGLELPNALAHAVSGVRNKALSAKFTDTVSAVREGGGLTRALEQASALPDLALRLIRIGEQSGQLERMLEEVANLYDQDVRNALDRLMAALVPAVTIGMGLIVAGLIASVLIGIMSVNQLAGA